MRTGAAEDVTEGWDRHLQDGDLVNMIFLLHCIDLTAVCMQMQACAQRPEDSLEESHSIL